MKELCNILLESGNGMLCCAKRGENAFYRRYKTLYDSWYNQAESENYDFNNRVCRRAERLYDKAIKIAEEKFGGER